MQVKKIVLQKDHLCEIHYIQYVELNQHLSDITSTKTEQKLHEVMMINEIHRGIIVGLWYWTPLDCGGRL